MGVGVGVLVRGGATGAVKRLEHRCERRPM